MIFTFLLKTSLNFIQVNFHASFTTQKPVNVAFVSI